MGASIHVAKYKPNGWVDATAFLDVRPLTVSQVRAGKLAWSPFAALSTAKLPKIIFSLSIEGGRLPRCWRDVCVRRTGAAPNNIHAYAPSLSKVMCLVPSDPNPNLDLDPNPNPRAIPQLLSRQYLSTTPHQDEKCASADKSLGRCR